MTPGTSYGESGLTGDKKSGRRAGQAKVAADEIGVAFHERSRVGELGEAAVVEVLGRNGPGRTRKRFAPSGVCG